MTGPVPAPYHRFPATTLPWVVAACAVVVYSLTLNPWISFSSMPQVASLSGWLWEPDLSKPLYCLVTLPLRAIPETWVPAALNLLNALCAAAVLGLLVRTVAILPHNRTHEQRIRIGTEGAPLAFRSAWLPPTLAAVVCGLQLTFWEHATAGTPEMLNLLLFAYVIRCLLEFRLDRRAVWLWQTALLYGAGMANSYAFVGFFPLYLVGLVWLKRLTFFDGRFLLRMMLLGLLGASLYALMPLLQSQNADVPVGFWQSLNYVLASQKVVLLGFPLRRLLLLSLFSLVPILLISIRWPQAFGDLSPQGAKFATFMVHVAHGVLLVVCIWIAFDPPVSPRQKGLGMSFLTFYYLAAVAIGYFVGYFLVIFGRQSELSTYTYGRNRATPVRSTVVAAVWVLSALTAVGLVFRNLTQIRLTNSPMLRDYASLIADEIPEGNTVVLTDDAAREFVLRSALLQRNDRPDTILLNTASLLWPQYHRIMARQHPDRWPVEPVTNMQARVHEGILINLMLQFSKSNQMCYAHPSFGYYFEYFQTKPAGILNRLTPYPPGQLLPSGFSTNTVHQNERFWDQTAARLLATVQEGIALRKSTSNLQEARASLTEKLYLVNEENQTAEILARWLSRSLNSYGVELQRSGFLQQAAKRFEQAVNFNPDNVAASVNLKFNADLQANRPSSVKISKAIEDQFSSYRGTPVQILEQVINANGLFDEPGFTRVVAETFLQVRLYRQSLQEFDRVCELLPNRLAPLLAYARLTSLLGDPDQSLKIVEAIRRQPDRFELTQTNRVKLLFVEATAHLAKKEPDTATQVLEAAIEADPANTNLLAGTLQLYVRAGLFSNALSLIDRQLEGNPDNAYLLGNKGFVLLRMTNQVSAVEVLTQALRLQSNNAFVRLNRAIANLQLDRLDAAQSDYEALSLRFPNWARIYYGLGEIAYRRNATNQAIYNYRLYLSNSAPRTVEAQHVRERLEALSQGAP